MIMNINTVLPEDTSLLSLDPQRESVTLVTCTPFGVNTHRLLVRGERIEVSMAERIKEDAGIQEEPAKSTWTQEYLKGIGFGCLGIIGLTALILGIRFLFGSRETYALHPARRGRHEKA